MGAHTGLDQEPTLPHLRKKEERRRGEIIVIENIVRVQHSKPVTEEHLEWN